MSEEKEWVEVGGVDGKIVRCSRVLDGNVTQELGKEVGSRFFTF
jgi:hypothetical protein